MEAKLQAHLQDNLLDQLKTLEANIESYAKLQISHVDQSIYNIQNSL